jgi:hypothetical protein
MTEQVPSRALGFQIGDMGHLLPASSYGITLGIIFIITPKSNLQAII